MDHMAFTLSHCRYNLFAVTCSAEEVNYPVLEFA